MRIKTEARRNLIIREAWKIFRVHGYTRTTMTAIAERLGGSKGTLYGYFRNKEELLLATIDYIMAERGEAAFDKLYTNKSLTERLTEFSYEYITLRTHKDCVALDRILIAEAPHSNFGQLMQERLLLKKWCRVADFLKLEIEQGNLYIEDTNVAAFHLRSLLSNPLMENCLFCNIHPNQQERRALASSCVTCFMQAYAVNTA